jgi:bifunctional ADP-heptose synthase (sugar kinase/adenylyltransferase)
VAVDPKDINFFQYTGADLFKPNLREASHALRKSIISTDLPDICSGWRRDHHFDTVAITLGANGIYLQNGEKGVSVQPDRAIDVIDVCGAGDAVICALALGRMSGLDLEKSGALANLTGAYVCSHSGVVAIHLEEIYQWI